jgi:hypothetical protein
LFVCSTSLGSFSSFSLFSSFSSFSRRAPIRPSIPTAMVRIRSSTLRARQIRSGREEPRAPAAVRWGWVTGDDASDAGQRHRRAGRPGVPCSTIAANLLPETDEPGRAEP